MCKVVTESSSAIIVISTGITTGMISVVTMVTAWLLWQETP